MSEQSERRSRRGFSLAGGAGVALVGLVAFSLVVRFVVSLRLDAPWIAPDEMTYAMLGRTFWSTGHPQLLDGTSGFYGVYPLLAGAPLAAFGTNTGLVVLKGLQACLIAVPVVVVYLWARNVARSWWALAAAAMTAALPAFTYSGLIMTEVTFLALVTLVLWRLSRALVEPSLRNQALVVVGALLAAAIRFQGIVILPTIVASVGAMALFSRNRGIIRRFAPTWLALGVGLFLWVGAAVASGSSGLGSYGVIAGRGYAFSEILRWIAFHAADVFLIVLGAPIIGALILAVSATQGRESEPVRALVAVTFSYGVLLVVEVAIFVSRFEHRLAERDLISIAPPLFVAFAAWLARGAPRPPRPTAFIAIAVLAGTVFWPVGRIVVTADVPDSFTTIPLFDLLTHTSMTAARVAWIAGVAVITAVTVLIPRRFTPLLAVMVIGGLAMTSIFTQVKIDHRAAFDRGSFFGTSSPQWLDRTVDRPVVFVDDDPLWNASWQLAFWNRRIKAVATIGRTTGARPDKLSVSPRGDGLLLAKSGSPLSERLVLARSTMTLFGRRVTHVRQGRFERGLTLWKTRSSPRLSTWARGVLPNPVTIKVYSCVGALHLK